jgi:quinol monooxygenase YgiN
MSKPHTVIVVLEVKPGCEDRFRQALLDVAACSRAENTCLEYRVHQSIQNPMEFVLYETWESQESHQKQFSKPYIIAFGEKAPDLLAKPYQVILAQEI